ncbi:MAG: sulfite exporter TauE/SafE family protein [Woeseiaceae bacterium]
MALDWIFVALVAGSFVAAAFNAAFSVGGAVIILATTTAVLPVTAVVPIHSGLLIGSTVGRAWMFRSYIDWKIARPFLLGSLIGTTLGARTYFELPAQAIGIAIAIVMLLAIWLPAVQWRPKLKHPWAIVGLLHSLLSTLFAYGAVLQSIVLHVGLKRKELIATTAGCLSGMSVFKIAGYAWFGFDYRPYLVLIAIAVAASLCGTWLGKRLGENLPEKQFRLIYRLLITVTALRLLYTTLTGSVG